MDDKQKVMPPDETINTAMRDIAQDYARRQTDDCCNCLHEGKPSLSNSCLTCVPPRWVNWRPKASPVIYHYTDPTGLCGRLERVLGDIYRAVTRRPGQ